MLPVPENTLFCMIDMQEKFAPAIHDFEGAATACGKLLSAAKEMNVSVLVTEQYPKGLGPTVAALSERFSEGTKKLEKLSFSCFGSEKFCQTVKGYKNLIIAGIESHICVLQTAVDAVDRGYQVYIPADAVSSRKESDRHLALEYLRSRGVHVMSTESVIFLLLGSAASPVFKAVQKIIK